MFKGSLSGLCFFFSLLKFWYFNPSICSSIFLYRIFKVLFIFQTLANLEVEKKVLGDILSTYETLMECIDDTEEDNR